VAKLVQVGPIAHIVPVTIVAAEAAEAGEGIEEVAVEIGIRQAISKTHLLAALDTTKYGKVRVQQVLARIRNLTQRFQRDAS